MYVSLHIKDIVDKMGGAVYRTILNMASSILRKEKDEEKAAFPVPQEKFEFNIIPYVLCNAD